MAGPGEKGTKKREKKKGGNQEKEERETNAHGAGEKGQNEQSR